MSASLSRSPSPTTASLSYHGPLAPSLRSRDSLHQQRSPASRAQSATAKSEPEITEEPEIERKNAESSSGDEKGIEKFVAADGKSPGYHPQHPLVQDYIRNYLYSKGFLQTFTSFQNEWYDNKHEDDSEIPSVYVQNTQLESNMEHLENQLLQARDVANKAKDTFTRLRKQRDFHRLAHKQVLADKTKQSAAVTQLNQEKTELNATIAALEKKLQNVQKELVVARLKDTSSKKPPPTSTATPASPSRSTRPIIPSIKDVKLREWKMHIQNAMQVSRMQFHPKKRILVVAHQGWKALSFPSCNQLMEVPLNDRIIDMALNTSGSNIALLNGNSASIWDFASSSLRTDIIVNAQNIVYTDSDDIILIIAESIYLYNVSNSQAQQTFHISKERRVTAASFRPNNQKYIEVGYEDGGVDVLDVATGDVATILDNLHAPILGIRWSLNSSCMLYWSHESIILRHGEINSVIPISNCSCASISSNGEMIVVGTLDGNIIVIYREHSMHTVQFLAHSGAVRCVDIDRNDEFIVSAGDDGLKVWS